MKVLLINGSPHEKGCTYTALCEAAKTLKEEGVETDFFWIGKKPIAGCAGCGACAPSASGETTARRLWSLSACWFRNFSVNK